MNSKKSVHNLAETIHSLLGFKSRLNSTWVKSVCDIIKNIPHEGSIGNKCEESATDSSKIKEELAALTDCINQLNIQRRQVLNDLLDLKGNIRVFCRVRPFTLGEHIERLGPVVALDTGSLLLKLADNKSKRYTFDKVFHPGSSQDEVFSEVEPVIKSVVDGYNACIFAYGQTGTGKTFTMEGTSDSPGIVPRTIEALFKQTAESNHTFLATFSMLEIYLGNLKDLLVPQPMRPTDPLPPCLSIQSDPKGAIEIENLVTIQVSDFNQALKLYRLGCRLRSTASTNSNATSSRSHCMIRISITCFNAPERRRETNKIWLVDLGGSERVMKTKAWGRRLDEGKAINLSLSALGDVINALQRNKNHIPYRNSKLTRVLKDSLGEDSKTLMLVHVSPKEEDLCETICSLNFATRVKSVHLGHEESNEVRSHKEAVMKNLQQKIEKIEDERQHMRRKIKRLKDKLEGLTRTGLSLEEQVQLSQLSTEEPPPDLDFTKNRIGNVITALPSQLPRFMRSTICSRRKSGKEHQTSVGRDPVHSRRRRQSSQRAESVTFPVKNNSECNSDRSISRSTCAVELNMKASIDNDTEYSQDTSEFDIKMVVFPEQNISQVTSNHQMTAQVGHLEKNGSRKSNKCCSTKILKVDQWLDLRKSEPSISGYAPRNDWVLDIPISEKKQRSNGQKKTEILWNEKVSTYDFATQRIHSKKEKRATLEVAGRSVSERVVDKPPTLKDLFVEESISNFISPPHATRGQTTEHPQDSLDGLLIEDNQGGSLSPPDFCCDGLEQFDNENEFYATPMVQAINDTAQSSDSSMLKNSRYQFSPPDMDNWISNSQEIFDVSALASELEWYHEKAPSKMATEVGGNEDVSALSQSSQKEIRQNLCRLKSQRALSMDDIKQKDLKMPLIESQEITQNKGACYILKQKVQISWASALLGLGFLDLGFDHDFFYGLVL
ncbi:PREDICTED: kinesin KP1 isoform X1 [Theobroma cacao]|uniref:Kinesin KP1 isoform X1 n=1 Tax=Theobroma cacao TaxID=3641 RepID=A0AB32WUT6_THECC|nr:PREDICTED: kinesin KP1 isoform X1 [Theobroma cacao]XP_017983449.1 PREDICTED: kinesin KP1 isoform X1 [Theobroma cacao]